MFREGQEYPAEKKEKTYQKVESDIETFDGEKGEIDITLDAEGIPKTMAFFDIDNTLGEFGFIHGEAIKKIFPGQNPEEVSREFLRGINLGTTYRVFHRMIGIYLDGHEEWKDPQKYMEWFLNHQEEVDGPGPVHDLAAEYSLGHSKIAAQMAEEIYKEDPRKFEEAKIKPVFHLAELYKKLGIPMAVMTANDEYFAEAACKCLGLSDSFISLASQKVFEGRGKEGAMEYLIERMNQKGIPTPKNLIVVGDSLLGDIGSGARFMKDHKDFTVKAVLVGDGDIEAARERVNKNLETQNMSVEILSPENVMENEHGTPQLARYRNMYETK